MKLKYLLVWRSAVRVWGFSCSSPSVSPLKHNTKNQSLRSCSCCLTHFVVAHSSGHFWKYRKIKRLMSKLQFFLNIKSVNTWIREISYTCLRCLESDKLVFTLAEEASSLISSAKDRWGRGNPSFSPIWSFTAKLETHTRHTLQCKCKQMTRCKSLYSYTERVFCVLQWGLIPSLLQLFTQLLIHQPEFLKQRKMIRKQNIW